MRQLFCFLAVLFAFCTLCSADGFIVIHDPPQPIPGHFSFAPLEVTYHKVSITIDGPIATTRVDQEFYNPNAAQLEGTYLFPLPAGGAIDRFAMDVAGKMTEAELLDADRAKALYENIVRQAKDPALLEYVGRDAFKARIFPIEPHGKKKIVIQYTQTLKTDSGLCEYVYPLSTEKFSARPLRELSVKVQLKTDRALKSIYSPSHPVRIERQGERAASIEYEAKDVRPDVDFKLIYTQAPDAMAMHLLSYRDPAAAADAPGYFLLMVSPGRLEKKAVSGRDICFVIDTSGSMNENGKMPQAQRALRYCLANLNANDRFQVVRFSSEAENLFDKLVDADKPQVQRAVDFVEHFKPSGGTAIDEALTKALSFKDKSSQRPFMVLFLTDGLPTVGETSEEALVKLAEDRGTRLFCFGIGNDVNTHLLDRLAEQTRGVSQYVLPKEDIEVKISAFYDKIQQPVLTNLSLDMQGDVRISELYPHRLPDIFNGDTLMVLGRYQGQGTVTAALDGVSDGGKQRYSQALHFAKADEHAEFIPRLWATRRIGWLLDEIRQHGESAELKNEITRLARQFGIVTPYTAFLILEDEQKREVPVQWRNMRELEQDRQVRTQSSAAFESMKDEAASETSRSGGQAVANAQALGQMRASQQAPSAAAPSTQNGALDKSPAGPASAAGGYRQNDNYAQQARQVANRTFFQNGQVWTDGQIQTRADWAIKQVTFASDEYFALLKKYPQAAAWLALGNQVDLVLGDTLYQVR